MLSQDEQKAIIIDKLRTISINGSCRSAGVSRMTYYRWIADDQDFAAACELSRAKCEEDLIALARKDKGSPMKLLAALFRDDYQERLGVTVGVDRLEIVDEDRESEDAAAARQAEGDAGVSEAKGGPEMRPEIGEDLAAGEAGG